MNRVKQMSSHLSSTGPVPSRPSLAFPLPFSYLTPLQVSITFSRKWVLSIPGKVKTHAIHLFISMSFSVQCLLPGDYFKKTLLILASCRILASPCVPVHLHHLNHAVTSLHQSFFQSVLSSVYPPLCSSGSALLERSQLLRPLQLSLE